MRFKQHYLSDFLPLAAVAGLNAVVLSCAYAAPPATKAAATRPAAATRRPVWTTHDTSEGLQSLVTYVYPAPCSRPVWEEIEYREPGQNPETLKTSRVMCGNVLTGIIGFNGWPWLKNASAAGQLYVNGEPFRIPPGGEEGPFEMDGAEEAALLSRMAPTQAMAVARSSGAPAGGAFSAKLTKAILRSFARTRRMQIAMNTGKSRVTNSSIEIDFRGEQTQNYVFSVKDGARCTQPSAVRLHCSYEYKVAVGGTVLGVQVSPVDGGWVARQDDFAVQGNELRSTKLDLATVEGDRAAAEALNRPSNMPDEVKMPPTYGCLAGIYQLCN